MDKNGRGSGFVNALKCAGRANVDVGSKVRHFANHVSTGDG